MTNREVHSYDCAWCDNCVLKQDDVYLDPDDSEGANPNEEKWMCRKCNRPVEKLYSTCSPANSAIVPVSYTLEIDARETKLINCIGTKVQFETSNLDVGDIVIRRNGKPVIVFERKVLSDFASSIKGERYRNQKIRLKTLDCMVIYLVEGGADSSVSMDPLYGAWVGITLRDNMYIIRSFNLQESADILMKFYKRAQEFKFGSTANELKSVSANAGSEYLKTIKLQKKANVTPSNAFAVQLAQIPGVSTTIAEKIQVKYPTMRALICHYESIDEAARPQALKKSCVGAGVGKVISERIYKHLYGIE